MKVVHRFNVDGIYIEDVLLASGEDVPNDCTEISLPQPNYKPIFNQKQNKWIETITEEELIERNTYKKEPTDIELITDYLVDVDFRVVMLDLGL